MSRFKLNAISSAVGGASVAALFLAVGMRAPSNGLTSEQFEILQHMSLVKLPDGQGAQLLTLRISDINLQLVNGMDETPTANGLGNLVIGYGEMATGGFRTGSHNLVGGVENSHSSSGGLVMGQQNEILGRYATVTGGAANSASGWASTVSGGVFNEALEIESHVCGGTRNRAEGPYSSIVGGNENTAAGFTSVVGGGEGNVASHEDSTVTGGCGVSSTGDCSVSP